MAMKKAEMEAESFQYRVKMKLAADAERRGLYRDVVDAAVSGWPYVDGMVLYQRKYSDNDVARIEAFDLVLRYAPLLLDFRPLMGLELLLAEYKRVLKQAFPALTQRLGAARAQLMANHRLWAYLEQHPGAEQEALGRVLGGDQDGWRAVAEAWDHMGLLIRVPAGRSYRLTETTRMAEVIPGKCPNCGQVQRAPKAALLEPIACTSCGSCGAFVLLSDDPAPAV
jgi:hypothetical protein